MAVTVQPTTGSRSVLLRLLRYSDVMLAVAVLLIIAMLVIPMPLAALDILITSNIAGALVILLVAIYTKDALQFSVFPPLLLLATLFRLALNVLSTRLILLHADGGQVIDAFGNFVVGGNYVVGVVVFLILVVIQFVVITNGAGRVAEVAARFTLDAMPGKQVSIDADLNAGAIDEAEARRRRRAIENEADFYGAMDGASKFVRGDAIAGIIIIFINSLGGFIIGALQLGLSPLESLQTYTLLTVGDGLVTQIPALLISTATGIIVTRASSDSDLGHDLASQLLLNPRPLFIAGGVLFALGLVPGLPKLPFLTIAAALGGLGYLLRSQPERDLPMTKAIATTEPESFDGLLAIDPIELEIGYSLVPLVDMEQGGNLLSRITLVRRQVALDLGLLMPPVRVRDSVLLDPRRYQIKLRGTIVATGEVRPERYLAMNPGLAQEPLDGLPTTEPAFGLPALWIERETREQAEVLGYTVVDPSSVIATHLTEIVKTFAPVILSRQDVQSLLNYLKQDHAAVVEELMPNLLSLSEVHRVLQNLLREQVSIRDMATILETLANFAKLTTSPDVLAEFVRQSLGRAICSQYTDEQGVLHVFTLEPELQDHLLSSLQAGEHGFTLALELDTGQRLLQGIVREMEHMANQGYTPTLVTAGQVRQPLRRYSEATLPKLVVLSYNEIPPQLRVQSEGRVSL